MTRTKCVRVMRSTACALALVFGATAASAQPLLFSLLDNGFAAAFTIESSPVVVANSTGLFFTAQDSNGVLHGFGSPAYQLQYGYGLNSTARYYTGPALYTGGETTPTFKTGTFNLFNTATNQVATLNIAAAPGAPAPLVGLGAIPALVAGASLFTTRRRRRKEQPAQATEAA